MKGVSKFTQNELQRPRSTTPTTMSGGVEQLQVMAGLAETFCRVMRGAVEEVGLLLPPEFLLVPLGRLSPLPPDR